MSEDARARVNASPPWNISRTAAYSLLVGAVFLGTQVAVMIIVLAAQMNDGPGLNIEESAEGAESNGLLLSLTTMASAVLCIPLVQFLVGRREADPWSFLGFRRTHRRAILTWSLALIGFASISDAITIATGRPLVPAFMVEAYESSVCPAILFAALVLAAPAFEEVFFRGFVPGALESSGLSVFSAAVISSLAWAAIHLQYDGYDIATIFLMGMLLAAARAKTGSLVPCLVMHALANVIAFSETALVA